MMNEVRFRGKEAQQLILPWPQIYIYIFTYFITGQGGQVSQFAIIIICYTSSINTKCLVLIHYIVDTLSAISLIFFCLDRPFSGPRGPLVLPLHSDPELQALCKVWR